MIFVDHAVRPGAWTSIETSPGCNRKRGAPRPLLDGAVVADHLETGDARFGRHGHREPGEARLEGGGRFAGDLLALDATCAARFDHRLLVLGQRRRDIPLLLVAESQVEERARGLVIGSAEAVVAQLHPLIERAQGIAAARRNRGRVGSSMTIVPQYSLSNSAGTIDLNDHSNYWVEAAGADFGSQPQTTWTEEINYAGGPNLQTWVLRGSLIPCTIPMWTQGTSLANVQATWRRSGSWSTPVALTLYPDHRH